MSYITKIVCIGNSKTRKGKTALNVIIKCNYWRESSTDFPLQLDVIVDNFGIKKYPIKLHDGTLNLNVYFHSHSSSVISPESPTVAVNVSTLPL